MKLSYRLQIIFEQLQTGVPVWDLCCDHGYLGERALESQLFSEVHFCDRVSHIIEKLQRKFGHQKESFFYAEPVEDLKMPLTGNVVLAGIGAQRIVNILSRLEEKGLLKATKLVLGPQKDETFLEEYLRPKQSLFAIKVFKIPEGGRQRSIYVLESKGDSGMA